MRPSSRKPSRLVLPLLIPLALGLAEAPQHTTRAPADHKSSSGARSRTTKAAGTNERASHAPVEAQPMVYTEAIRENNIGMALMEKHAFTDALANFQRACILNPASDTGCLNIGIALFNMGRYDDAAAMLKKSAEHDPLNPRPWFNLALLERESGNLEEARQDFEKAAALDPNDPGTQYFLGLLAQDTQRYQKAAGYFQNAINLGPSFVSAEYGLAQAEERMGDADG